MSNEEMIRQSYSVKLPKSKLNIYSHAVSNYYERVVGVNGQNISQMESEVARDSIKRAVRDPEMIHHKDSSYPPIHIRGSLAAVVDNKKGEPGVIVVPTVYNGSKYRGERHSFEV